MSDPTYNDDERKVAIKFNLEQADQRFVTALSSATRGEQVRQAIEELHSAYSDEVIDSAGEAINIYIPMYIAALQNLKSLPEDLKKTIDMSDYDQVTTILDGLSDDFFRQEDENFEKDEDKPSNQWNDAIDQLFQELGVLE